MPEFDANPDTMVAILHKKTPIAIGFVREPRSPNAPKTGDVKKYVTRNAVASRPPCELLSESSACMRGNTAARMYRSI